MGPSLEQVLDAHQRINDLLDINRAGSAYTRILERNWTTSCRSDAVDRVRVFVDLALKRVGPVEAMRFAADWPHGDWLPI